jgi:hypothetical protein
MAPGRPSKKAGQPQPESNLVVDLYNGVPHAAHSYNPSSLCLLYFPVPAHLTTFTLIAQEFPHKEENISQQPKNPDHLTTLNPKPKQIDARSSQDEPSLLLLSSQGLCMLRSYQRGTFQEENIRPRVSTCKGKESIAKFIHTGTRERERKSEYSLGAFLTKDAELLRTKHGSPFLLSLLHRCSRGCG